VRTDQPAMRFV